MDGYDQIKPGMEETEVESLIGWPADLLLTPLASGSNPRPITKVWFHQEGTLQVRFDDNGILIDKDFKIPGSDPHFDQLRKMWGL